MAADHSNDGLFLNLLLPVPAPPTMSRSAYFSSDDAGERSLGVSFLAPPPPRHHVAVSERQLLVHSSPSCSEFPLTSYVLWDRSPLSASVRSVGSRGDSFPPLYISSASIDALLSDMDGVGSDVVFAVEQQVDGGVLSLSRVVSSPSASQASVPVSVVAYSASLQSLLFRPESTQDLIKNLRVQYMTGRNYTLKSCFRLRAAGFISNSTSAALHGTLRFEVLVPNETFSFQQIRPLPLLSTPLSLKLSSLHGGDGMPRQMGYLTLNKTRKAVPLHETDPAVSLAPLVGVWVTTTASVAGSCETAHRDPFVVGACVRFLKDSRVRERVFVDSEKTFLLAIFSGYSTEFMEVTHESANADYVGEGDDFSVLDFTVDLARGGEPVLGNFRGGRGQGWDHKVSTTSDASVAVTSLLQIKYYGDVQILTSNNNNNSSSSNDASVVEETPLPRTSLQLPTPEAYRASPQGTLRVSLNLSEGTFSNRSSLDDEQLMRVRELVGGLRDSEEYADDFDAEDDAAAEFGRDKKDNIEFEESDGHDDESSSCSSGSGSGSGSGSDSGSGSGSGSGSRSGSCLMSQGPTLAANLVRTSPQQASKELDSDDDDYLEDASMLAPRLMSIPNDDSDFTLSSAMRRIYFPTNPLASLSPCVPALRPLGEDDSLLMETGMVGLRLSTNSNPFSAAVTQDLEEQVRDIMLHDDDE